MISDERVGLHEFSMVNPMLLCNLLSRTNLLPLLPTIRRAALPSAIRRSHAHTPRRPWPRTECSVIARPRVRRVTPIPAIAKTPTIPTPPTEKTRGRRGLRLVTLRRGRLEDGGTLDLREGVRRRRRIDRAEAARRVWFVGGSE